MNPAISSFVAPVAPQMPPQSAAPAPSSSQPGFSQMLSRAQAREAEAPAETEGAPQAASARPASGTDRAKGEKAGKAEKANKAEGEPKTDKAEAAGKPEGENESPEAEATDKPAADPALAEWLAVLQRPAAPQEEARGKGGAGAEGEAADAATSPKNGAARGALAAAGKDVKAQDAAEQARDLKARAEPATREATDTSAFKAAMAEAAEGRRELKPVQELHAPHNTAAAGLQPAHGAARGSEAAAPAAVQVPTPATSPDFAQALGVQVSVLAKDGIQQAELHLNPADMGPISVQIAIDGTQAQVNFGADSAATRQIIESGLPELAASLRDAGFTLSGGGVHSQARGREQGGEGGREGERGGSRAIGGIETDVTTRRVIGRVSAGGVDLYA